MRLYDSTNKQTFKALDMYLTPSEAANLANALNRLLCNPEKPDHEHVFADDMSRELAVSIITEKKLQNIERYHWLDRQILLED